MAPPLEAELLMNLVSLTSRLPPYEYSAPPSNEWPSLNSLFEMEMLHMSASNAPPLFLAVLFLKLEFEIDMLASFDEIAAPLSARLSENSQPLNEMSLFSQCTAPPIVVNSSE